MRYLKWVLTAAFLASIGPANAQVFGVVFFCDSNTDSGPYLFLPEVKATPATFATFGGFTTNPGPMWSTALGSFFDFPVTPSDSPTGGNNFAAGGARVPFQDSATNEWSGASQIAAYLATTGGAANPNTLYIYWLGADDLKPGLTNGLGNIVNPPNFASLTTLAQQSAALVSGLAAAGARYILIPHPLSV